MRHLEGIEVFSFRTWEGLFVFRAERGCGGLRQQGCMGGLWSHTPRGKPWSHCSHACGLEQTLDLSKPWFAPLQTGNSAQGTHTIGMNKCLLFLFPSKGVMDERMAGKHASASASLVSEICCMGPAVPAWG